MVVMLDEMKTQKAAGPSDVSPKLTAASEGEGIQVMAEIYQRVLDGLRLPADWAPNTVVPIFKAKGDIRNCGCHRVVKLLEHGWKVLESMSEKRLQGVATANKMRFGFMPGKRITDVVSTMRRLQEHHANGKVARVF